MEVFEEPDNDIFLEEEIEEDLTDYFGEASIDEAEPNRNSKEKPHF